MLALNGMNSNTRLAEPWPGGGWVSGRLGLLGWPELLYPSTTLPPRAARYVFLRKNLDREMKSSHPSPRARFHGRRRAAV